MSKKVFLFLFSSLLIAIPSFVKPVLAAETKEENDNNKQYLLCNQAVIDSVNKEKEPLFIENRIDTLSTTCTGGSFTSPTADPKEIQIFYKFYRPGNGNAQDKDTGSVTLFEGEYNKITQNDTYQFCSMSPAVRFNPNPPAQSPPIVTNIVFKSGSLSVPYPMSSKNACTTTGGTALGPVQLSSVGTSSSKYDCVLTDDKKNTACKDTANGNIDSTRQKCSDSNNVPNCGTADNKDSQRPWYVTCTDTPCVGANVMCSQSDGNNGNIKQGTSPYATEAACRKVAGGFGADVINTPTPTPPPPPCASNDLKNGCTQITSAFGLIQTDPSGFIKRLMAILLSLSGGIALFMIIRSGYQLITSQGNAEKVKESQDRILSAVIGLLFIIMSLVILEVIGVDILNLPGLTK